METFEIPFNELVLDREEILRGTGISRMPEPEEVENQLDRLIHTAAGLCHPRCAYGLFPVESAAKGYVAANGRRFAAGPIIARCLKDADCLIFHCHSRPGIRPLGSEDQTGWGYPGRIPGRCHRFGNRRGHNPGTVPTTRAEAGRKGMGNQQFVQPRLLWMAGYGPGAPFRIVPAGNVRCRTERIEPHAPGQIRERSHRCWPPCPENALRVCYLRKEGLL